MRFFNIARHWFWIAPVVLGIAFIASGPEAAQASHGNVNVPVGRNWFIAPGCQIDLPEDGVTDLPPGCVTTIHAGDTVTWGGSAGWAGSHTVTGCPNLAAIQNNGECPGTLPIGDSGFKAAGSTHGPITFATAGTYYYKCNPHSADMLGKVVVLPAATPTPSPGAAATPTPTPAAGAATPSPTPTAGAAAVPQSGSAPGPAGSGGPLATIPLFAAAAVAFLFSALAFRKWYLK